MATGYELNPALVAFSRLRSLGRGEHEKFALQSLWDAALADADVVFVYGVPSIMGDLSAKLMSDCVGDTLVVSNGFPIPNLEQAEIERTYVDVGLKSLSLDDSSSVYLYRI